MCSVSVDILKLTFGGSVTKGAWGKKARQKVASFLIACLLFLLDFYLFMTIAVAAEMCACVHLIFGNSLP